MNRLSASFLPPIALARHTKIPKHRQVYEWFRRAIIDGQLRAGQRVPSTRALAAELKISRIPVLNAYEQLLAEGYFEGFVGAGTCIARSIPDEALRPVAGKVQNQPQEKRTPRRVSRRGTLLTDMPAPSWLQSLGAFRVSLPALDHFPIAI